MHDMADGTYPLIDEMTGHSMAEIRQAMESLDCPQPVWFSDLLAYPDEHLVIVGDEYIADEARRLLQVLTGTEVRVFVAEAAGDRMIVLRPPAFDLQYIEPHLTPRFGCGIRQ